MAIGDVFKLTARQDFDNKMTVQNTYYFSRKTAGAVSAADALALANAVKEVFRVQQGSALDYTDWSVQQVNGSGVVYILNECRFTGGLFFTGAFTGTLVGAIAGEMMPPQTAFVTTIFTGLSGRRRRGRHYLCGRMEADQANGVWTPTIMTALAAVWTALFTLYGPTGSDANWTYGQWSQRIATGCAPSTQHPHDLVGIDVPNPADAFRGATGVATRNTVFSQRRRTIGVGR